MRLGRLLLVLLVLGGGYWLLTQSGIAPPKEQANPSTAPVERARAVAKESAERTAETQALQREADSAAPSGAITENMTPDQVKALLGPPDETVSETTETGATREKWTYRSAGKTVVFENGVVVRIE